MELRRLRFELTTEEGVLPAIVAPHPACPALDGERIEREREEKRSEDDIWAPQFFLF